MANPVVANILKTGAILYLAPVGEALPDETTISAGEDWGGDWERVGFTKAPLTLKYTSKTFDIEVEEFLSAVDRVRTAESATIETVLAETTAAYFTQLAGGSTVSTTAAGASQVGYEQASIGGEALLEKYAIGFEGSRYDASGNELPVRFFFDRATLVLNGDLVFTKREDQYVGLAFQAAALVNTTTGRLLTMQRVTAPATS